MNKFVKTHEDKNEDHSRNNFIGSEENIKCFNNRKIDIKEEKLKGGDVKKKVTGIKKNYEIDTKIQKKTI